MKNKDKDKKSKKVSEDEKKEVNRFENTLKESEKLDEALEVLVYNTKAFNEAMNQQAKMYGVRYRALIKEGFTKEQAFEIVLKRGLE